MQFYRRNLPHLQRDATPHFITIVTKFRWNLPPPARDIVLSCCRHDHRTRYELHVGVVMPDHVHMILTPLLDEARGEFFSLVEIMRTIKSASAHLINRGLRRQGTVWQEESFDRVLRASEKVDAKGSVRFAKPGSAGHGAGLGKISLDLAVRGSGGGGDDGAGRTNRALVTSLCFQGLNRSLTAEKVRHHFTRRFCSAGRTRRPPLLG
jgi:putative transposase